jgi:hypothetical protein
MAPEESNAAHASRALRWALVCLTVYLVAQMCLPYLRWIYQDDMTRRVDRITGEVERYDGEAFRWVPLGNYEGHRRAMDELHGMQPR